MHELPIMQLELSTMMTMLSALVGAVGRPAIARLMPITCVPNLNTQLASWVEAPEAASTPTVPFTHAAHQPMATCNQAAWAHPTHSRSQVTAHAWAASQCSSSSSTSMLTQSMLSAAAFGHSSWRTHATKANKAARTSLPSSQALLQPPHAAPRTSTEKCRSAPGDPGSVAYSAPVPLPTALQATLPRVLYTDPWVTMDDRERRVTMLRTCLDFLRSAGPAAALTAEQVCTQVNAAHTAPGPPPLSSPQYTQRLLEFLRNKRLVVGSTNHAADLARGHPDYAYLYTALPYQQLYKGPPAVVAKRQGELQAKRQARALRRLRRGKTPFAIHRQVARSSCFQQALAYEAVAAAQEQMGMR